MEKPYPLLLERRLSRRLWGGMRLEEYLGLEDPGPGEPLAEAWQVYGENLILNGTLAGRSLANVAAEQGASLLGTESFSRYGHRVPLLAKFIDAARPLSIQVHPDDDYALENEAQSGHLGKAEAWYILQTEPGAAIIWGVNRALAPDEVREAVAKGTLESHLQQIEVAAGDVIYNAPGTIHAIGAGIFLFEIQQSSDLTYRLYDYGRVDASGKPRQLHLDKALDVADLQPRELPRPVPLQLGPGQRLLIETEHFAMEELTVTPDAPLRLATSLASLELVTGVRGSSARLLANGTAIDLPAGVSSVLPAALGEYRLEGDGTLLRCYVPVG